MGVIGINDYSEEIIQGMISKSVVPENNIYVADKNRDLLQHFSTSNVVICDDYTSALIKAEIIIITKSKSEFESIIAPMCAMTRRKIIVSTDEDVDCEYILTRVTGGTYAVQAICKENSEEKQCQFRLYYSNGFPEYLKKACEDIFGSVASIKNIE